MNVSPLYFVTVPIVSLAPGYESTRGYSTPPLPVVRDPSHTMSTADVKTLTTASISDDVIIGQGRNSHAS
jgi:hypothetical protein